MTERKLKKLKKAEENKILKEHEGLYARLVKENYSEAPLSATAEHPAKKRRLGWIYGLSVGAAAMLTLFASPLMIGTCGMMTSGIVTASFRRICGVTRRFAMASRMAS